MGVVTDCLRQVLLLDQLETESLVERDARVVADEVVRLVALLQDVAHQVGPDPGSATLLVDERVVDVSHARPDVRHAHDADDPHAIPRDVPRALIEVRRAPVVGARQRLDRGEVLPRGLAELHAQSMRPMPRAQLVAYPSISTSASASSRINGLSASTMIAYSSANSFVLLASIAAAWGPCWSPWG